ncbi:hypothetical protein [Pseudomonas typographi]|uniref:hypothetical protein n=1 Tax=Pseudomonas typographi TaxID=2715964 RepID=UPI0016832204|nr:hypothetical protein [Pseudomonas typographi]MBD1554756.1 hypothetical protein [Pseudomonas typographi]
MVQKVLIRTPGANQQYTPLTASAGAASAGNLVALGADGLIDPTMLPETSGGDGGRAVTASEALAAGAFVNLFNNSGTVAMRNADNSNTRPAHGYVKAAVASAASGTFYDLDGVNDQLTGLTPGSTYYLGTGGAVLATPLDPTTAATGLIDQPLGVALSATELKTNDYDYVVL